MIIAIIIFILILGFLVFVHEFGHFILAKKLGVKVEEFGIGFPPAIWKKKKGETVYSINLIPLGGFNKLYGEEAGEHIKDSRSFSSKSPLKRAVIILGGVAMNFLTAAVIFYFLLGFSGFQSQFPLIFDYEFPFGEQENFPPAVTLVVENSPAEEAGLEVNDFIISGNGVKFENTQQLIGFLKGEKGKEVVLAIKKISNDQVEEVSLVPRVNPPEGQGAIGIALADMTQIKYDGFFQKLGSGFLHSLNLMDYSLKGLSYYVKASLVTRDIEPLASSVTGPVGILALTKLSVEAGFTQVIFLIAIISLALALVNIFPIPPLDGGRFVFILFEMLTGKTVPAKVEKVAQNIGLAIFIILFILVTSKDLFQFKDILFK